MAVAGIQPQQTVNLRVQVIDMNSFTLDLRVPTYLPAKDLTQRVARDAGLDAFWPNGKRREYWMRARGRLMGENETLAELNVVNGELVYLLPQPPEGSGVLEQPPEYPENRGYAGKGTLTLVGSVLWVMLWAVVWGAALTVERDSWTVIAPGMGLGLMCTSFARHAWGGQGSAPRVAVVALLLFVFMFALAFAAPVVLSGEDLGAVYAESVSGLIFGFVGVMVGWLAWWGAVEPLPAIQHVEVTEAPAQVQAVACGVCGLEVGADVRSPCPYGCGRVFHSGCYKARSSVYRGDPRLCGICNARIG